MPENEQQYEINPSLDIRITGLNKDKTRKTDESDVRYQVYFELSEAPAEAWRTIFEQEWKTLNPDQPNLWPNVNIDNRFLVVHCLLQDIVDKYFPVLKKAVTATNSAYHKYVHNAEEEHQHRVDVWTNERKAVDDIAKLLKFD